jgi:serine protease SohB
VLRERFGKKVQMPLITPPRGLFAAWRQAGAMETALPGDWAGSLVSAIEARSLWSRYGL